MFALRYFALGFLGLLEAEWSRPEQPLHSAPLSFFHLLHFAQVTCAPYLKVFVAAQQVFVENGSQ